MYTALLTSLLSSVFMNVKTPHITVEYERLRARLADLGWISNGYVQDRGPGAGGPCYQWTRKVKAKTVSVALSKEQYQALKQAIDNWHELQAILQQMQALSRQIIFETLPNPPRRKRLNKKVLGIN
jgi:cyclopropane fatty-acyl-phospholipid synthase-like methyltransferase